MKFSLFNNFGALNSAPVFAAIEQGLKSLGHQVVHNEYDADAAVIWSMLWTGRMQGNREVWKTYQNKPIIVAEVGMLDRGNTWKIGLNGTGVSCYNFTDLIASRAIDLGLTLAPWRTNGNHIVIALQRQDSQQWSGLPDTQAWVNDVCNRLKKYTDRPIVIRSHPRQNIIPTAISPNKIANSYDCFDFDQSLKNAWAVVNWSSGPGPQSIINGVPAFVGTDSLASLVSTFNLAEIENPAMPDRGSWLNIIAHSEWTLDEIASGHPIQRLLPGLVSL
jgi:hypothetical protein